MRTSARAAAVENKAVTATTKHIALFVKRKRFAPMIALHSPGCHASRHVLRMVVSAKISSKSSCAGSHRIKT
jgi:hypothetical protein